MKKAVLIFLLLIVVLSENFGQTTPAESRKKMLKMQLDYRFKGGTYTFENIFYKTIKYPEVARENCIQGIIIASFNVTCDGKMSNVSLKNPLHYGIEDEVRKFFDVIKDKWNTCKDDKYVHFEIPIQFKLEGTEMNAEDALFVFEDKNPGYICRGDSYFLEKANKYLKKGNGKTAIEYLNVLIKRDPYNMKYYELKKQAVTMINKKKVKKKNKKKKKKQS